MKQAIDMRKPIYIAAGAIAALLAIAAAILLLLDVNQFREPIRAQLEKRLKRSVSIGALGLKLVPLSVRLDQVSIGESPAFASPTPFLSAQHVYVRVGWMALLNRQVDVESLRIEQPAVELIRNPDGEWNAATLGQSSRGGGQSSLELSELAIEDGRIAVTDLERKTPRAVYDHVDVTLRDFKPGKRFGLDARVHLPGQGAQSVTAHLAADTPSAGRSIAAGNYDGNVALEAVTLAGLESFLGAAPSGAAGAVFNGKAQFQSRSGVLDGKGHIEISEARLKEPARVDFDVRDDSATGLLNISNGTLKLGALTANGNATVRTKDTPATVTGGVRSENASLADVLRLAAALGVAQGISGTGTVSMEAHASGPANALSYAATGTIREANLSVESLRKPVEIQTVSVKLARNEAAAENIVAAVGSSHLRGSIAIHDFAHPLVQFNADVDRLDTAELEQLAAPPAAGKPSSDSWKKLNGAGTVAIGTLIYNQIELNDVRATCKLEQGLIRLDPLTAKLFGGAETGSISIDTRRQATAFDVRARLQRVDADRLLSSTTAVKKFIFGTLSGDIDLHASPQKGQEIARALNGSAQILLTDGKLAGVHLMNEMAGIAKFLGYAPSNEAFTDIVKLGGTMKIQNGVANTDDLQLQFDGGSMAAAGSIGLADQELKLRVTTVLAKGFSRFAGGNSIAGLMSTALGNGKGELVIPALVSGTFSKPRFEPDPQRIAKMRLEGLMPAHGNPGGPASAVQGILGALAGPRSAQPGAPGAPDSSKAKSGLFGIIDSVRKQTQRK